jgi:hypothetical protein
VRRIPLWARDGSVRAHALVSARDYAWLNRWRWCLHSKGYAERKEGGRKFLMHRQILGLEPGDKRQGEHRNRNPLDCQRSNLRIAARGDLDNKQNLGLNANNTSGYRGVTWSQRHERWRAQVMLSYHNYYLGLHDTAEEADAAAKAFRAKHMPFSEDARVAA